MISYSLLAFLVVSTFASVHLWAKKTTQLDTITHGRFLSMGGGVAIAYVFVDLLPKLSQSDAVVGKILAETFPYLQRHVYVMALLGFLLFFIVDRTEKHARDLGPFYLSLGSYALFNFFVGYAVADPNDPEVQPLVLFTIAMTLHYFVNDYSLNRDHSRAYQSFGKWILIASLYLGWFTGQWIDLPATGVALISAFIGGGVIMNVTRHELPKGNPHSLGSFLMASFIYTVILLSIGT